MSRRNLAWLVTIVVVGVIAGYVFGVGWGFVAGGAVVVVSEVVERVRRRRRGASGGLRGSPVRSALSSRRRSG